MLTDTAVVKTGQCRWPVEQIDGPRRSQEWTPKATGGRRAGSRTNGAGVCAAHTRTARSAENSVITDPRVNAKRCEAPEVTGGNLANLRHGCHILGPRATPRPVKGIANILGPARRRTLS